MIVSNKIQKEAFDSATKINRVVILDASFIETELSPICDKVVSGKEIHQRRFKRFTTDQHIEIERMVTGEMLKGFAFNLSQGGAYLTLDYGTLVPGDIIRMNIKLDKIQKAHFFFAKVIWVMKTHENKKKLGAGVRFVSAEVVYSNLLDTVK